VRWISDSGRKQFVVEEQLGQIFEAEILLQTLMVGEAMHFPEKLKGSLGQEPLKAISVASQSCVGRWHA
jgi:hypothetical protein